MVYSHCPLSIVLLACLLPRSLGKNVSRSMSGNLLGSTHRSTGSSGVAGTHSHCSLSHMKNALTFNETHITVCSDGSVASFGTMPSKLWLSGVKILVNYFGSCKKT